MKYLRIIILLLIINSLGLSLSYSQSNQPLVISSDKQFEYATHLFNNKEFYRAISEYHRFMFFFPKSEKKYDAQYQIAMCYVQGKQYDNAITVFQQLIEESPSNKLTQNALFQMSLCHEKLNHKFNAQNILFEIISNTDDKQIKDKALYQLGIQSILWGDLQEARSFFNSVSSQNQKKYNISWILNQELKDIQSSKKSPFLAGLLALIPGGGHIYCKRYRDAILSFLINGGILFAAFESFDHDQPGLGAMISLFEAGFYVGNIYSAISCAHKYNRNYRQQWINKMNEIPHNNTFSFLYQKAF